VFEKIAIIVLTNFLFYAKTLTYKYCSDDIPSSQRPKHPNKWMNFLLSIEGHLKVNPFVDHLVTMVFHTFVCIFLYTGFGATDISFLAALYFAFNPINNQGSVWISGRGYVLSALGMLMAMTFPFLGPLFLVLATYSNAGFIAPIVFLGSPLIWFMWWMPLVWGLHFVRFKKNVVQKMNHEMFDEDKAIHPRKLILGVKTFSFYMVHALIPIKNTFYHSYMQSLSGCGKEKGYSLKDRFFWIGLVLIACIVWRFIAVPWDMVNFGLLWWCVCIAPFCNIVRMQQEIAERYAYLPNVGLMFALASMTAGNPYLMAGIIVMYATKMWFWMDAYQDDYYLVETSCINSPDAWFGWHVRGMRRWDQQSYQEAVIIWTMARLISPKEFKINFNLATALKMSGHHKEADQFLVIAGENIPKGQEAQVNELITNWKKGQLAIVL
jgi:hypothetical protein